MSVLQKLRSVAGVVLAGLFLGACDEPSPLPPPDNGGGGGGGTLTIVSTSPAAGSTTAEFSSAVTAVPSIAVGSASATVTNLALATEPAPGADVPRTVLVANNGFLLEMSASLVPATAYRATLASTVQATTGAMLGTPVTWTFTTRGFQTFALDSGRTNGYSGDLGLARDGTGGLHAVYADSLRGDLFYVTCPSNCTLPASWRLVALDTLGNIGSSSSVAVGSDNRVHITYRDDRQQLPRLRYATCLAPCADLASFRFATIDQSSLGVGVAPQIVVGADGSINITYYDFVSAFLRYAECSAADCAVDANWSVGTIDNGPFVGQTSALQVNAAGLRQVVYQDSLVRRLRYAVCTANCAAVGAWLVSDISAGDEGKEPSLALGNNGTLFLTYYAALTGDLIYGECLSSCSIPTSWARTALATPGLVGRGSQISVNARNRRQVIYADEGGAALRYATCVNNCTTTTADRWRFGDVQTDVGVVRTPVAVTRPDNSLQVLYLARGGTTVRFAE